MRLGELAKEAGLEMITAFEDADPEVAGAYTGDLLSDVIAHTSKGYVWITVQTHVNIVAVATLKELAAIIVTGSIPVDNQTVEKANMEHVNIYRTKVNSFQISGRLYELGIR